MSAHRDARMGGARQDARMNARGGIDFEYAIKKYVRNNPIVR